MPSQIWEYKIEHHFSEEKLNALGRQGWEAVGMTQRMAGTSELADKLRAGGVSVLFKRPVVATSPPVAE